MGPSRRGSTDDIHCFPGLQTSKSVVESRSQSSFVPDIILSVGKDHEPLFKFSLESIHWGAIEEERPILSNEMRKGMP